MRSGNSPGAASNPRGRFRSAGFTLIELMIAVAIVGILAVIAVPSYIEYVVRSNRAEGRAALEDVAQQLERCMTMHSSYDNANCNVSFPVQTDTGVYVLTGNVQSATFTLSATPQAFQAQRDTECGVLTLISSGLRGADGNPEVCWYGISSN